MAADLMDIELVRGAEYEGNSRANEARRFGEEIDEKLKEYEEKLEKLGAAARQKKSRARKGADGDEKIRAIDAKLFADRESTRRHCRRAPAAARQKGEDRACA